MSGYKHGVHSTILCDEGSVRMVLDNKKLFQSAAGWVTMCSSATNMYSYAIWPHGLKFILTSNLWESQLKKCKIEDRRWIDANSVYIKVTEPLWNKDDLRSGDPTSEDLLSDPLGPRDDDSDQDCPLSLPFLGRVLCPQVRGCFYVNLPVRH